MVTQTHFQWWFREENGLSKSWPISMKSTNPQKRDTPTLGLPRSLEPFLVGYEQKSFCQNVFYNNQVGQPRNFYQNSSTLIKMRGKFSKLSKEIYNTGRK